MFDILFPEIANFKTILDTKPKVQMPEHSTDNLDLDMSVGEHELARRFPEDYERNVNGIKRIVVRDEGQEYRYKVVDGQVISQGKF